MRYLLYIFLAITISACNNKADFIKIQDTEIGDAICIAKEDTSFYRTLENGSRFLQKGSILRHHYKGDVDTIYTWGESVIIGSHVNDMIEDDLFMLVEQKPLDEIFGKIVNKEYAPHRLNMPNDYNKALNELRESKVYRYWIIDKNTNDLYGPFNINEYLEKRKQLNVPVRLKLKSEK